ncbi:MULTISPECIES: tyrosine-type recombinase/integrase [Prauserella salsuginis group]|uniref:Tyrosine-type recombinase/integrase n=1 Tax=Prauserella salsuginis TaxID=387889 RepID=A0ABW6G297_9PSEU|nr:MULTISPECIES: tyrosine-type recombinase/integrase [Prauserella salsuginis group]
MVVGGERFGESFSKRPQADSFRSDLKAAQQRGEAFSKSSGLPASMSGADKDMTWIDFARDYVHMKWADSSANHRRSTVQSLIPLTMALVQKPIVNDAGTRKQVTEILRAAGRAEEMNPHLSKAYERLNRASMRVRDLENADVARAVLRAIEQKLDGTRVSANTSRLRRVTLSNAVQYAIEKKLLAADPFAEIRTKRRKASPTTVEPTSVVNPVQARTLINAAGEVNSTGKKLMAFFALLYYAGLRPEEAVNLKKQNLSMPASGWGELRIEDSRPEVGRGWTDSGEVSEEGALKHREAGESRTVPVTPELTEMLHNHLFAYSTARDGRLFRGSWRQDTMLSSSVYARTWAAARAAVLTPEVAAGPLAKRPYDLRHACVSQWLSSGVEPPRVARWAGHSLSVLLRVYAKCIDGGEQAARERVERGLRGW